MDTDAQPAMAETETGNGDAGTLIGEKGEWVPQSDFAKSAAESRYEPGGSWNNKKARDEFQRAYMQIEDKNFSLSEWELELRV